MGKNLGLNISLSRKSKHYRPGDVVSGECVLQLADCLKLRCVSIEFQGESWTYWEETEIYTTTHKNAEIYFHKKTSLYGNSEKKQSRTPVLAPGRHVFQFNFKIPPYSLPSSFESKHGYVRYWLKARIDRPWRFDVVTKEEVNILSVIDVNCPQMLLPTFGEAQKSLNCLHNGMASPLKLSAFVDRSAYCARDHMVLSTDIKNLPLTETYRTSVYLVQTISFKSRCGKSRTECYQHKIVQRPSLSWAVEELELPDVPPTMKNCGILSIAYHIKISLSSCDSGGVPLLEVELPITIGTVPLQRSYGTINKLIPVSRLSRSFSGEYKTFVAIKMVSADSIAHCSRAITA